MIDFFLLVSKVTFVNVDKGFDEPLPYSSKVTFGEFAKGFEIFPANDKFLFASEN